MAGTDPGDLPCENRLFQNEDFTVYKPRDYLYVLAGRKAIPVCIYVLEGSEKAMVIDSGCEVKDLKGTLAKITTKPTMMVLTHGHHDHTAAINEFDELYMNTADQYLLPEYKGKIIDVKPGHKFDLGGLEVEVFDMQGHTNGSIGYLDTTHKLLFTGDAIGAGLCWMHIGKLPLESLRDLLNHIVMTKGSKWEELWPAHYGQAGGFLGLDYIQTMLDVVQKIVRGEEGIVKKEDKAMQERFNLPFTPLIVETNGIGVIYNPLRIHYV